MKIAALALVLVAPVALAQVSQPGGLGPAPGPGGAGRLPGGGQSPVPATPPPAGKRAEAAKAPIPRGAVLEEVSGTVREVDRKTYRLSVDTASGPVTISLDRNSMVYTANGLGTVLDLAPGQQIRAGRNADFLAYWVQLRQPTKPASPAPGTGPAGSGAAAPASEPSGKGTAPTEPPPGGLPPSSTPEGGAGGTAPAPRK